MLLKMRRTSHAQDLLVAWHVGIETLTDFTPLGLVVEAPRVIITPKNFPANTLQEFIASLKAKKGMAKYGHAGAGSASHVSCILFNAAIGVDIVAVPYPGF